MNTNPPRMLCATDFSERARRAASVAATLAARRRGILVLAHVVETHTAAALALGREKLQAESTRLAAKGATVEQVLLQAAAPAKALLKLVQAQNPRLIVVAAAVKGATDRWALGSVA